MARRLIDNSPAAEQRRQQRMLMRLERQFSRQLAQEIARASREMIAQYELTRNVRADQETHERNLYRLYEQLAATSIEFFGDRIVTQGKNAGLILETKSFAEFFQRLARQYIGLEAIRRRITSVTETTREQIINQVDAGQREGLGVAEIAKRIADNVPLISRQRGALIARTETHGAANYGADGAARETGLKLRKEWVAAEDERTRSRHADADGQVVDMDQPFRVGGELLMYPGDPAGSAGNIINCRCAVSHIVDDGLE